MKRVLATTLAAISCFAHAQTPASPPPSTIVNTISPDVAPRDGFTRLRLNLTFNEASAGEMVRLVGVAACSPAACFEAGAPSSVTIATTANGTSRVIAELELPYSNITSVRFKSSAGPSVLQGSVSLPEPLKLERDFQGGDVLVVVRRRAAGYEPAAAAAGYLQPEGTSIYYNPTFATTVRLLHGVTLTIPAGATSAPQVFLAGVHDTGDDYPLVDIFPVVKFAKAAKVQLPALVRSPRGILSNQSPASPNPRPAAPAGLATQERTDRSGAAEATVEINATGVVRPAAKAPAPRASASSTSQTDDSTSVATEDSACSPGGWCDCAAALSFPLNQQIIANALAPTGSAYLDWCTGIPPYVHITVSNLGDPRERFTVKHAAKQPAASLGGERALPLTRLTSWGPNTQVLVNGFTWKGDQGTNAGQFGTAEGHVHDFANGLGDNLAIGGGCEDYPPPFYHPCNTFTSAGNKRVLLVPPAGAGFQWQDNAAAGVISNSLSYVSSSTSIVKNGVCATDSLGSRWSAIGTTSGGRIVVMSSTDQTTTAAQLCPAFQALGVANAIRLDGGPSAQMTVDGALKNPLTGLYFIKYGSARYVPYALKVSYPGW